MQGLSPRHGESNKHTWGFHSTTSNTTDSDAPQDLTDWSLIGCFMLLRGPGASALVTRRDLLNGDGNCLERRIPTVGLLYGGLGLREGVRIERPHE